MLLAPPTAEFNLHHSVSFRPGADGMRLVRTTELKLDPADQSGGFILTSAYRGDVRLGTGAAWIPPSTGERRGAQAVADALRASGLLFEARPADGRIHGEPGMTRIFFDRRSTFVEFPTDAPPAAAQGLLAALASYALLPASGH